METINSYTPTLYTIYTRKDLESILSLSKTSVLNLLASGEISSFRINKNGSYRVTAEALADFIDSCGRR